MLKLKPMTDDELKKVFGERLTSDQWWIFYGTLGDLLAAKELMHEIEESYYWGAANVDFEIMFDLSGMNFVFSKKSHMSAKQLARILNHFAAKGRECDPKILKNQNCIALTDRPELYTQRLHNWIIGGRQN